MDDAMKKLTDWAVRIIETDYKNEVCLLLNHKTLLLKNYWNVYVPAARGWTELSRTFTVGGDEYDLYHCYWEDLEALAALKSHNTAIVAEAEILYAKSGEDRRRFLDLQARFRANIADPRYMYARALDCFDQAARLYGEMVFLTRVSEIKSAAGNLCDRLAMAVAFANQTYFTAAQTDEIKQLKTIKALPERFVALYEQIVLEQDVSRQISLCHEIIANTRDFLAAECKNSGEQAADVTGIDEWLYELRYSLDRIYYFCERNDPVNAYIWCCAVQSGLDRAGDDLGVLETGVICYFNPDDLPAFKQRLELSVEKLREAAGKRL